MNKAALDFLESFKKPHVFKLDQGDNKKEFLFLLKMGFIIKCDGGDKDG